LNGALFGFQRNKTLPDMLVCVCSCKNSGPLGSSSRFTLLVYSYVSLLKNEKKREILMGILIFSCIPSWFPSKRIFELNF
jgi:hypothetical protein